MLKQFSKSIYKKVVVVGFVGVIVAAFLNIGTIDAEIENNQNINIEQNDNIEVEIPTVNANDELVSTEEELREALENPIVKKVILVNDIYIRSTENLTIQGQGKGIEGRGYKIESIDNKINLMSGYTWDTYGLKDVELKNIDIIINGQSNIKNIKLVDGNIIGNSRLYLYDSVVENGYIYIGHGSDIYNTSIINSPTHGIIIKKYVSLELHGTIAIESSKGNGVYSEGNINLRPISAGEENTNLILKNTEGTGIFLKGADSYGAALYIEKDSKITQTGDKYTVYAEKESMGYSRVLYEDGILEKGTDKNGDSYYNTIYRSGVAPVLPSNNKPVIEASDVTLKIGDIFDSQKGVTANDKEDGDITSKISVKENTVDTSKVGIYKIVYKVSDNDGNITTKEIKVIVNKVMYTVSFDTNGGLEITSIQIENEGLITPEITTMKTGYTFEGWYKDIACTTAWNFATDKVIENTTLYAKWTINKYNMSFNSQGGSSVSDKSTDYNSTITAPAAPTKTGYTFGGWYKEVGSINAWNFATDKVTQDTMLYAKWTVNKYSVNFDSQGGSTVSDKSADYNASIMEPAVPTRIGYKFNGWYTAASGGTKVVFPYVVKDNITLYAQWSAIAPNIPSGLTAKSLSYNSTKLTWSAVTGASGYEVYRATSSTGKYTLLTSTTALNYTNTGLTTNSTYYYKIRAYKTVGTTKLYSNYTTVVSAKPIPSVPTSLVAKRVSSTSTKLTWSSVTGASGYEIYRATSSTGTYTLLTSTTSTNYTNTKLTAKKTYYYKVRSYRIVGKTKVYSGYTTIVSIKM